MKRPSHVAFANRLLEGPFVKGFSCSLSFGTSYKWRPLPKCPWRVQKKLFGHSPIIKQIVPVLDSDWLSHARSCCKLLYKHTPFVYVCVLHFVTTTTVSEELHCLGGRIMLFINIFTLICSVLLCETLLCIWNHTPRAIINCTTHTTLLK